MAADVTGPSKPMRPKKPNETEDSKADWMRNIANCEPGSDYELYYS